jgi:hypothetical protein
VAGQRDEADELREGGVSYEYIQDTANEMLQACIKECREEIGRARGRREKLLGEDYARSDYIYGLESAIEIIEKVMKEGP